MALTFDDGPDPDSTPAVLDALERAGASATFFVMGEQLGRHWPLARDAQERGHELGLHGFAHSRHDELTPAAARDDVARAVGAFEAALGRRPTLFRPPYGRFAEASFAACASLGLIPVYWSAWGTDWEDIGAERIAETACRDLTDGTVLLLHDSARYADRPSAVATADAVPLIVERAARLGIGTGPIQTLGDTQKG